MMAAQLLIPTHEFAPRHGGIATYVGETAAAARELGWDVTILAPRSAHPVEQPGWRVLRTDVRGRQDWPDRLRLREALHGLELDWSETVLWIAEPGPLRLWMYPWLVRRLQPRRLVLTLHGSEVLRFRRPVYRRRAFCRLVERADRVGVVSEATARQLARVTSLEACAFARVPGAVSASLATALAAPVGRVAPGPRRVLTVGRVHPRKGQLDVVEALGRLPRDLREQTVYEIIGPVRRARYLARLRGRARHLGVQIEGPREAPDAAALARAYQSATVMVLSSREAGNSLEGFGLVYLEAAAAGCPVIAADSGGAGEAVGPENGLVVPPRDPEALAQALRLLLEEPERAQALGAAGPAWAHRFSWEQVARTLFGAPGMQDP